MDDSIPVSSWDDQGIHSLSQRTSFPTWPDCRLLPAEPIQEPLRIYHPTSATGTHPTILLVLPVIIIIITDAQNGQVNGEVPSVFAKGV